MTTTSSSITVDTAELLALLRDVREAASDSKGLPFLAGVMLNTVRDDNGKPLLVATATDRFCALQGTVLADDDLPGRFLLSGLQLSQLAALLRPYATGKRIGAQTSIEFVGEGVRFRQVALETLGAVSIDFARNSADGFPDMPKLFARSHSENRTTEPFHIDPSRMVRLARIGARRNVPLAMHGRGPAKAVVVRIGADLHGLLMPWRAGADAPSPLDITIRTVPVLNEPEEAAA